MRNTLNRGDNRETARGMGRVFASRNILIGAIIEAYDSLVSVLSIPARLLVRKNKGERAFTATALTLSLLVYAVLGIVVFFVFYLDSPNRDFITSSLSGLEGLGYFKTLLSNLFLILINPALIFLVLVANKAQTHFNRIRERRKEKLVGHSYHRGESISHSHLIAKKYKDIVIDDEFLRRKTEPFALFKRAGLIVLLALTFIISLRKIEKVTFLLESLEYTLISIFTVGFITLLCTLFLYLEEYGIWKGLRYSVLDAIDGELDMNKLLELKNAIRIEEEVTPNESNDEESSKDEFSVVETD